MKYVVYVSHAKAPFSSDALAELLRKSRVRNTEDSITGLLLYRYDEDFDKGYFIQAIEGPEAALDALWDRIGRDMRHHSIITLAEGVEETRMFPNWTMGFKNVDADDFAKLPGFTEIGTEGFWRDLQENGLPEAVNLMRGFYDAV
jgi:hypothetical protein